MTHRFTRRVSRRTFRSHNAPGSRVNFALANGSYQPFVAGPLLLREARQPLRMTPRAARRSLLLIGLMQLALVV
ncbi:MAG: hypothetical protein U0517_04060 [Candidatus Andersenbacteria bacterium]